MSQQVETALQKTLVTYMQPQVTFLIYEHLLNYTDCITLNRRIIMNDELMEVCVTCLKLQNRLRTLSCIRPHEYNIKLDLDGKGIHSSGMRYDIIW
jgi:hypothetical protein